MSAPNTPTLTSPQWSQFLTQFAQLRTQFGDQQQLNQKLQVKLAHLESQSSLQNTIILTQYETKLEEYFYQIEQSTDDIFCQHQLELLNLISVRVNHVDYRGAALRDLFQLRRGIIPRTISNITVGDLVKWLHKRLKETMANTSQHTYYHTLLKATHFDHPIMSSIALTTLPLNPNYFPTTLMLWSPVPPTPIEYHRLLVCIAYDLDYCENSILPLITHFGLPVSFPKIPLTAPSPPPQTTTTSTLTGNTVLRAKTSSGSHNTPTDPFFYLGYSTHIPCLLYAPLWFGVLSRESFRDAIHEKPQINQNSFIISEFFSSICRSGYIFDQITRILFNFPLEGMYPCHQAYSLMMPRFFSSDEPLTDPITYPAFGNKGFSRIYAFLLFIASHLAMVHSSMEEKNQIQQIPTTPITTPTNAASSGKTPTNASNTANRNPFNPTPTTTTTIVATIPSTQGTQQTLAHGTAAPAAQPEKPLTIDHYTYPVIRDLYNAAVKGNLDCFSLTLILKSPQLFQHLTTNERNKTQFTRLFGIFHFKVLAGTVPSWLAKPLLGVPKYSQPGSVFEQLCGLAHVEHLTRYFDKSYGNCCDKRAATEKTESKNSSGK